MRFSATRTSRPARRHAVAATVPVLAGLVAALLAGCNAAPAERADNAVTSPDSAVSSLRSSAATTSTTPRAAATSTVPSKSGPASTRPASSATSSRPPATTAAAPRTATPPAVSAVPPGRSVSGLTVVLNPGHNGGNETNAAAINRQVPAGFGEYKACDTTGTNTNAGYSEHAFNWDVSLRVRGILQARGVKVLLTRANDSGVGPCVDARAAVGNQKGVAAVISIHADGTTDGVGHGFHVCEDSRQPAGPAVAALSHSLTVAVHDSLVRTSGMTTSTYLGSNGYYPRSDLAGLNLATTPSTFLELGNMRNAGDAAEQSSPDGRQRIAASVANGILAYLASR